MRRVWLAIPALLLALPACERETRAFRQQPAEAPPDSAPLMSGLQAGPPVTQVSTPTRTTERAYDVSEGKRLFSQFNCVGCHAHGGGAIGPPLIDEEWIYGSEPAQIAASIMQGRPNGMPAFARITPTQAWQLAAYVRALSGLVAKDVAPGRDDDMQVTAQEQQTTEQQPLPSTTPPKAVQP